MTQGYSEGHSHFRKISKLPSTHRGFAKSVRLIDTNLMNAGGTETDALWNVADFCD